MSNPQPLNNGAGMEEDRDFVKSAGLAGTGLQTLTRFWQRGSFPLLLKRKQRHRGEVKMGKKPNESKVKSGSARRKRRDELAETLAKAVKLGNLSILPPRNDGTKRPFTKDWKEYQNRKATKEELSEWYESNLTGFGLICGAVSENLECIDFDNHKIFKRYCKRMKKFRLAKLLEKLMQGYYEQTPRGAHFLYRCDEISGSIKLATKPGKIDKNGKMKVITLIETKGEGGYIICAPSYGGVNKNGNYQLIGGGLSTITKISASERSELQRVARTFHIEDEKTVEAEALNINRSTLNKAGRPGDDYNARADWQDILTDWTNVYEHKGVIYLRRPGKTKGVSATINYQGKDLFRNFSTSTPFELKCYDKFGAYAVLHHNGDFSAAAKQLVQDGYGSSCSGYGVKNEYDEAAKSLALSCFPEVSFPLEVLPDHFIHLVNAYSKALQCTPALMAMNFMTILSGAVGNAVTLKLKKSWQTAPFIWLGIIDVTGSGKSHPIYAAMKPLMDLQKAEIFRSDNEKANDDKSNSDVHKVRHYYCMNFTIEALIPIYKTSPQGIVIYVDELAGLIKGFNQYKRRGSDTEQFITLYNCGPLKSDRKIGNNYCPESGAAVIGGIQPGAFSQVFSDIEHENGLAYRFLPMMLNTSPPMYSANDLSEEDESAWNTLVRKMCDIPVNIDPDTGCILKHVLTLEEDGIAEWKKFHDELSKCEPFMPLRFGRYLPKLKIYCLKFMSVLHLFKCYKRGVLTLTEKNLIVKKATVEGSIKLTRYFAGQALKLVLSTSKNHQSDPYSEVFRKALISMDGDVKNGKLLLKQLREAVNKLLPQDLALSDKDKKIGTWLRDLGLTVREGTGNKTYVHWDENIIS